MPTLNELGIGARVAGPLLVLEIVPRTRGSHPATGLTLGDASARLPTAPFWRDARQRVGGLRPLLTSHSLLRNAERPPSRG